MGLDECEDASPQVFYSSARTGGEILHSCVLAKVGKDVAHLSP